MKLEDATRWCICAIVPLLACASSGPRKSHTHAGATVVIAGQLYPTGEVYGSKRLHEVLHAHRGSTASDMVNGVLAAVQAFSGHSEPHDDLTMLAARPV